MTVVIPFHSGDIHLTVGLLEWINQLGKQPEHTCLLVADAAMEWGDCLDCLNLANEIFRSATLITNDKPTQGWIPGSNSLFAAAAIHMQTVGESWFWLEPDATPLKKDWLESIATAYQSCGKLFMGSLIHHDLANRPNPYFEGCGVYPSDTWSRIKDTWNPEESWTLWCAPVVVPEAINSPLFQHYWGVKDLAPTFALDKLPGSPVNTFTLAQIQPQAALFHRCKDGSLAELLRKKLFPVEGTFVVVLPFCNKDGGQMLKNLRWMQRLGGCQKHTVVIAYDHSTLHAILESVRREARATFGSVIECLYATPPRQEMTAAAKWAFKCVSWFVQYKVHRPFLWWEADMVATKKGWIEVLQNAYANCRKPFFGPVIPDMGHFNGTAIYPPDTFQRCPSLNVENDDAWDTGMLNETRNQVADAMPLIQHAWVRNGDRLFPHGHGELPYFGNINDVKRMLSPTAVAFHRDKHLTLIDRLTEMGVA